MLFQQFSPQVHFLNDAAHLLSQSAPETSAFLMRRRNDLLVENDVPISDAQRQHVCCCCGNIMIPGQGDTLKIETQKILRSKTKKQPRPPQTSAASPAASSSNRRVRPGGISKVITCGNCSKGTRLRLEGPSPISRKRGAQQKTSQEKQAQTQALTAEPPKLSANASSKKRAKNRKAGLQALLDQKQGSASSSSSSFGLSLSDFMKK